METQVVQKLMTEIVTHQEVLRAFVGAALSCFPDDIDDVVQNANLAVIRRVDDYDPSRPLLPWLIAFAKKQILAFRAKKGAERLVFDEAALERLAETYTTCDTPDLPVMTRLAICKRKLDEETLKMLEERYGDDRKPREMAKLHKTTSREIRNRLTYARRKLAECIMRLCRISDSSFERDFGDATELEGLISSALDEAKGVKARRKMVECAAKSPEKLREYGELALVDALLRSQYAARRAQSAAESRTIEGVFEPPRAHGHGWLKAAGWGLAAVGLTALAATTGYIYYEKTQTKAGEANMNTTVKAAMVAVATLAQTLEPTAAATKTWTGERGTWQTASCWSPEGVPTESDIIVINSGTCEYVAGGDLTIGAEGSLTLNGGRFYQSGGIAWMKLDGSLTVGSGAAFDMGTSAQMNLGEAARLFIAAGGTFTGLALTVASGAAIDLSGKMSVDALTLASGSALAVRGTLSFDSPTTLALTDGVSLRGGTLENVNELQWSANREIAGNVSAVKLAAQAEGAVLTVGDGEITLSAALADTVYQQPNTYVNVKTGATTEFVFTHAEATTEAVYATLFAGENPKIRYGGEAFADEAAFRERFEVSGETGDVHVKAIALADDRMVFGGAATVAQGTGNQLTFSATVQKAGIPAGALYLLYGTTDGGNSFAGWTKSVQVAASVTDETAYEKTLEVAPNTVIYYVFALSNETEVVYSKTSPRAMVAGESANLFLGTASADAGDAANWSRGRVPTATDTVVFVRDLAANNMTWPADLTAVGGWLQPASETKGYVTFALTTNAPLTIAGDALLDGGVWTHEGVTEAGAEPAAAVAVSVGGDLRVAKGVQITAGSGDLNVLETKTRGWYLGGPGYKYGTGASYGGEGSTNDVVYGSVFEPMDYGSSGTGDSVSFAGGGLVWLSVLGRAQVSGEISSRGYAYNASNGGSTGGSLNLRFGSLDGSGVIAADAGKVESLTFDSEHGSGSGGRIAVRLTDADSDFSLFTGMITAYGNRGRNATDELSAVPCSAAGTVFLSTGAETAVGCGEIVVANGELTNGDATAPGPRTQSTLLPGKGPRCDSAAKFRRARLTVRDYGRAKLTASFRVNRLSLEGENAALDLNGETLTAQSLFVDGVEMRRGTYTAAQFDGRVTGEGSIIVGEQGFKIIIR